MSYPQPKASVYSANAGEFFPLNTLLSSPGDIYESDVSGHGFAVGPTSDIANIAIAYFDAQAPDNMQTIEIGPNRPFVGRVDANNSSQFQPSQRPGRILIWAANLYDPNFRPRAFAAGDAIEFIQPRLSVVQYFAPQASLFSNRIDAEFEVQNYPVPGGKVFWLVVPYYGRKLCSIRFTNRNLTQTNTFGITGVTYAVTDDSSANPYHQETTIHAAAAVGANGGSVSVDVKASADGMFDALVFSFNNAGPAPLRIIMSDQE